MMLYGEHIYRAIGNAFNDEVIFIFLLWFNYY
jgi:hypothetical protein